jgi:1,5-anhydro-D-fructose reductase (1,5-anhydro-D-mannitol-forming)
MTQQPIGEVMLRNADGEKVINIEHESLYSRGVASFCAAMKGEGQPAATAEDGVRSLAGALAVVDACKTGKAQVVVPVSI